MTETADRPMNLIFPAQARLIPTNRKPSSTTPESKYWASFKTTKDPSSLIHPITAIDFSPAPPHHMAISSSASVSIYSSVSFSQISTLSSSFTDIAYSPSFRCDGLLLAAGSHSGTLHIFDPASRQPLRLLRSHSRPARLVRFPRLSDKLHLFSGADDALLNYWDVPSETPILSFQAHKDYVRAGAASPATPHLFATGSYDHSVRLWDVRGASPSKPVIEFTHGNPVENVLFLPSGGLIATAGGNCVKIWDVIGGGRLVHTVESHNKTVTALCTGKVFKDGDEQPRLLSVSLDGYLKVFDFAAFKITHSMRHPAPLLSVGFSPSGSGRVAGSSNGVLFISKRKKKDADMDDEERKTNKLGGFGSEGDNKQASNRSNFRYFRRGQNEKPSEEDFVINKRKKVKLAEHDKLLKQFRHKDALVSALNEKNPRCTMAVMEELVARKKLLRCVANLDVDELGVLLGFLQRYVTEPRYAGFLMGLTKKVLQLRAMDVRSSDALRGNIRNLKRVIAEEVKIQHSLQEIQGIISPLLRVAGR
ncbi:protein SLOW WALKER 1 [Cinnamomum micranthum f. kanehirae]|uniref:Protein SLOW WALKER 1 n=1 Tax=Cinnamomum micranthum f. kanehirae TaxID=337451 RepID=A0A3S3MTE8_9MAGN|nr:protein SLOW WALKER 1 [Cinnamomum micranthum f. kanehirae]